MESLKLYDEVLRRNKHSPRALYGRAHVFHLQSEFINEFDGPDAERGLIENAINGYQRVVDNDNTPDELFKYFYN